MQKTSTGARGRVLVKEKSGGFSVTATNGRGGGQVTLTNADGLIDATLHALRYAKGDDEPVDLVAPDWVRARLEANPGSQSPSRPR